MRHTFSFVFALVLVFTSGATASAECFADYKAKRDKPLRLHYGVAQVSNCSRRGAQRELAPRLESAGWTLLNVVSVFDRSGLDERKESAGRFFLRF
ncbi:hypothetical protein R5H30_10015 [Sulfitobacter sp. D35]|uniref:hypothetical protein n=1 Tax=Sulfitobacter sp. D35 TaxID=3083252 RepID=UPI00296F72EB|nr:hypothetical protein [Sulfitobacter sp. D35]MDW4498314.1 hypothetical protein [Sulfitobacter sp. D35]